LEEITATFGDDVISPEGVRKEIQGKEKPVHVEETAILEKAGA
jgi:hypothetical protein